MVNDLIALIIVINPKGVGWGNQLKTDFPILDHGFKVLKNTCIIYPILLSLDSIAVYETPSAEPEPLC